MSTTDTTAAQLIEAFIVCSEDIDNGLQEPMDSGGRRRALTAIADAARQEAASSAVAVLRDFVAFVDKHSTLGCPWGCDGPLEPPCTWHEWRDTFNRILASPDSGTTARQEATSSVVAVLREALEKTSRRLHGMSENQIEPWETCDRGLCAEAHRILASPDSGTEAAAETRE